MGTGWYPRRLTADENERLPPSPTCLFRVFLLPRDSGQPPLGEKVSAFYLGGTLPPTTVG